MAKARHIQRSTAGIAVLIAAMNARTAQRALQGAPNVYPHATLQRKQFPRPEVLVRDAEVCTSTRGNGTPSDTESVRAFTQPPHGDKLEDAQMHTDTPVDEAGQCGGSDPSGDSNDLVERIQAHYRQCVHTTVVPQIELIYRRMETPLYSCPAFWEVHIVVDGERMGRGSHNTSSSIAATLAADDCIGECLCQCENWSKYTIC